jgi:hypothetical protein
MRKELALPHLFNTLFFILFLLLRRPIVTDIPKVVDLHADSNDNEENDNNEEDFEEKDSIQICCAWGEKNADRILTYNIDDKDARGDQQEAVRDAVEQWI